MLTRLRCSYYYVDHDGDGSCHQTHHLPSGGKWSPGTCDAIVRASRIRMLRGAHGLQGYGNSQGGGVWRGGNKPLGFDSESLG
jgi:hypothetical protein